MDTVLFQNLIVMIHTVFFILLFISAILPRRRENAFFFSHENILDLSDAEDMNSSKFMKT